MERLEQLGEQPDVAPEFGVGEALARLWQHMQRIERCRYLAEVMEARAASEDDATKDVLLRLARAWRGHAARAERLAAEEG